MSTNHRLFGKSLTPIRVHMDEDDAKSTLIHNLFTHTNELTRRELVIVCIGTDRSTGDSLGPLIGTKLSEKKLQRFHVYGTLEKPVHAVNLADRLKEIEQSHYRPYILAIDACLGRVNSIGKISLANGPVQPGAAVNKQLPAVGDIHITGIVNIGGMMEYFVLQNTRLFTVMRMADTISDVIYSVDQQLPHRTKPTSLLENLKPNIFLKTKKETPF
ncbi:spore protease YyaC [Alkalihalophilus pseudofirmus]|uniref:spore protease YyaC n=1 Tax=Alkalihalophilus pseudofirmus TaxID=79885 RepID=UPI00259B1CC2|nr:spore protease YyaC [Alkalihalophilus pseudofirmus]WEG16976.1 spore protease YyaC [Alkalihalophilus pseudofirmus]